VSLSQLASTTCLKGGRVGWPNPSTCWTSGA
jgi:hypothetical protein